MALTLTKKYKIIRHLGYPVGAITVGNINYSKGVIDRLNQIPEEVEPEVELLLTRIDSLESKITAGLSRAGIKKIDDIEFNGLELEALRKEKMNTLRELASIFDLSVLKTNGVSMGNVCIG